MTTALFWLTASALLTLALWLPYVLERIRVQGLLGAMGYDASLPSGADWAERAKKAHYNAVENFAVFAVVVIAHHLAHPGAPDEAVGTAAFVYFAARVVHFVVYAAKLPVVRTLSFFTGFFATLFIGLRTLGVL